MKITFTIELEYNKPDFEFATDETYTDEGFIEAVKEYAIEDLHEYIRSYDIAEFATINIEKEEN